VCALETFLCPATSRIGTEFPTSPAMPKCHYGGSCTFINGKCKWCRADDVITEQSHDRAASSHVEAFRPARPARPALIRSTCNPTLAMSVFLDANILTVLAPSSSRSFESLCAITRLLSATAGLFRLRNEVGRKPGTSLRADFRDHLGPCESGIVSYDGAKVSAPAICAAAADGDLREVRVLLAAGASVNSADQGGRRSALSWACVKGEVQIAQLLLAMGADVHQESGDVGEAGPELTRYNSWTPLHLAAAREGSVELVKLLLRMKANANGQPYTQTPTPLYVAQQTHGRLSEAVALLREQCLFQALGGSPGLTRAALSKMC